jgi:hypothetical protein
VLTESQWLASSDPKAMLDAVPYTTPWHLAPEVSGRKLRLFACACLAARHGQHWAPIHDYYHLAETGEWPGGGSRPNTPIEQAAAIARTDNPPKSVQADLLREIVGNPWRPARLPSAGNPQAMLAALLDVRKTDSLGGMAVYDAGPGRKLGDRQIHELATLLQAESNRERGIQSVRDDLTLTHWHTGNGHLSSSFQIQATRPQPPYHEVAWQIYLENAVAEPIIRRLAGNLLRPVWLTPTALNVAHAVYDSRAFDELPVLADALEEGGCDREDVLRHLRGEEWAYGKFSDSWGWYPLRCGHVLGCWALDLILGKV